MTDVYIVEALRTPIGRFQGGLSGVRPDDLAALVIREAVARTGVPGALMDEVIFGCANQAGEDNRNVARMALLLAGLPDTVPGVTVNRLCASGLEAVVQGARSIRCGDAQLVVVGGVESMSRAPYSLARGPAAPKMGNITAFDTSLGWRYPNPKLEALFPLEAMGETAENVAERYALSREAQDAFAVASHAKAIAAEAAGAFAGERIAVPLPDGGSLDKDEGPRGDATAEKLAKLKPVFRKGGSVTAGNSSTLNDGAAALVLASGDAMATHGLKPLARFVASAAAGVDPRVMGLGPIPATKKALTRAGWSMGDIQLVELNEAFAAQSLAVIKDLELDTVRVNVTGGAVALGHPLGCSGARILTTLVRAMRARHAKRGLASLCVGVGQGLSALVEAVD